METPTGRPKGFANQKTIDGKRRIGNPGKRALPEATILTLAYATTGAAPEPPRPLATPGRTIWDRVLTGAPWVDHVLDIECLLRLCEQADEHAALRFKVLEIGEHRARTALRALDAQIMAGLAALALSPVDRARMGLDIQRATVDPLDELKRSRGA